MKEDIENIKFGIYSSEEIKKLSVCQVTNNKMNGFESVYDSRMGVLDNNTLCGSCNKNNKDCPGHFGHIELNIDIIHPLYYKYILQILKCFCFKCHKCILSPEQIELHNINKFSKPNRLNKILELCTKNEICFHCLYFNPSIMFNTTENTYYITYKSKNNSIKTVLSEIDIQSIFNNISCEDLNLLGINSEHFHPKNLIIHNLLVLPPIARPYVIIDNMTCDDDLTIQYCEIVKLNNSLLGPNINESRKNKIIQSIKFRIKSLFDNSHEKAKHSNGRPMKGIKKRISGKEGQIRSNLMGKRVNQSARTVIGPDPTLRLDEIALPRKFANTLTFPEKVFNLNLENMTKLVNSGSVNYIIRDGNRINLQYAMFRKGTELLYNDIIKRDNICIKIDHNTNEYLRKGDVLIRNNNIVKGIKYQTKKNFRLEIGDIVERPLRDNDIVLLNRQPTLHRGSMLAKRVIIRDYKTIRMNLATTKTFNADFDGDEMNIHVPASQESNAELRNIVSTKWNMISPQSSKSNIAIVQDGLLGAYLITRDNIKLEKSTFFQLTQNLDNINVMERLEDFEDYKYTTYNLFSLILPRDLYYIKHNNANKKYPKVIIKGGKLLEGTINKAIVGSSHNSIIQILVKEYNEEVAMDFINNIQFLSYSYILYHGFTVSISDCIATKTENINNVITKCFIEATGNEDTIKDPRIREIKINASLSKARDNGMKIAKEALASDNNFISTVTSGSKGDFFNIAQITGLLGQQNLSGKRIPYTLNNEQRSLPHYPINIEDKKIEYESKGFIKNSFIHGLNPKEFWFHAMTGREGITDTAMKTATSGYIQRRIIKLSEDLVVKYDSTVRNSNNDIIQFQYGDDNLDGCKTVIVDGVPQICNIYRLVDKLNYETNNIINRKLTNYETIDILSVIKGNMGIANKTRISSENIIKKNLLKQLENIVIKNEDIIPIIKNNIKKEYINSQVQPGESVGIITGESIGERQTQMTLNTFHSAGLAISTVLTGVPRFSELLNASKDPRSNTCSIYINNKHNTINNLRDTISNQIRYISFKDIIKSYTIFTELEEEDWYNEYSILYDNKFMEYNIGIKFELNNDYMYLNYIDILLVVEKIREYVDCVIYNNNNLHIFVDRNSDYEDLYYLYEILVPELENIHISGLKGINDFFYDKTIDNNWYIISNGSNLKELLMLDIVDKYNTVSNNMWEIYELFGIEATRQFLIDEFMSVVSSDGTYINERHVKVLVDVMTQHGIITSISRYGMKKDNSGPLAKASFEQSLDNFIKASFFCEEENLNSVSSNILCGKKANIGTGLCELIQDFSYYE